MEVTVLGTEEAFGGEQAPGLSGDSAFDEIDGGFLAGFHRAELGVEGGGVRDQPVRVRTRTAPGGDDVRPGRPALVCTGPFWVGVVGID